MVQGIESRKLRTLFTPITVGNLELANRIVMPAIQLSYPPQGVVTDRPIDFYVERAAGGVGLLILAGCPIHEYGGRPSMVDLSDDQFVPGLTGLSQGVHDHGVPLSAGLYHAGRYSNWRWFKLCAKLWVRDTPSPSA